MKVPELYMRPRKHQCKVHSSLEGEGSPLSFDATSKQTSDVYVTSKDDAPGIVIRETYQIQQTVIEQ
ncbi:hypothetical protein YC2023_044964 [Brassica napus]